MTQPHPKERFEELKIALVHDAMCVAGGAEKALWQIHSIFPKAPIYTPLYRKDVLGEFADADIRVSGLNRFRFARTHYMLFVGLFGYLVEQFDLSQYDVVISDSSSGAKGAITRPDALHICWCHTPMRWAWLPYLDRRASSSWIRRLMAHYLRMWDVTSSNRVDVFFANSHTTAERIKKFYRRESEVIYPPVEVEGIEPSRDDDGYYVTVGRLIPQSNKRSEIIVEAAMKTGIALKVVGDGPLLADLKKMSRRHPNIEYLGYISDDQKRQVYSRSKAFLFASEEDAGIVPIEAMAYGKPVIAYGRGGGAETVIHGQTGLHFFEPTADSLALAIEESKKFDFNAATIAKHAQQFSSSRFREQFLGAVIKQVEIWRDLKYGRDKPHGR